MLDRGSNILSNTKILLTGGDIMTIHELEEQLNIQYPSTFHKIYESGAMEWLKHSGEWLNEHGEEVRSNPVSFFYALAGGDCEPILFPEVTTMIQEFLKSMDWDEEYKLGKKSINPDYLFIPFAMTGGGDLYCFLYVKGEDTPKITLYGHDTGEMYVWSKNFDEFLFIQLSYSVIYSESSFELECAKCQANFLKDEYLAIFKNSNTEELEKRIRDMEKPPTLEYIVDCV